MLPARWSQHSIEKGPGSSLFGRQFGCSSHGAASKSDFKHNAKHSNATSVTDMVMITLNCGF